MLALLYALAVVGAASASVLHPNNGPNLCLHADKIAAGGAVTVRKCNGKANQQWTVNVIIPNHDPKHGAVHVVQGPFAGGSESGHLCLSAGGIFPNYDPKNGDKATLVPCPRGFYSARNGTMFSFDDFGSRFILTNGKGTVKHYCLDNTDGKTVNGNPVQVWECELDWVNDNQRWTVA